ncbi:MAG: isoprenylcysteine carboxylmethyltransferase family protein [Patescibacteria group bacterium]
MRVPSLPPLETTAAWFGVVGTAVTVASAVVVLGAVLVDFVDFHGRGQVKKEQRSVVETGSMMLFFILFYILIRFRIGQLGAVGTPWFETLIILGSALLVVGCVVNVRGRFRLGQNWSNQVVIYRDHTLVTDGVYSLVRHPLYASTVWMFIGASLVYVNYLSLLATLIIFIPFMVYRAKQEEAALRQEFSAYATYQQKVGMFVPKIFSHHDKV